VGSYALRGRRFTNGGKPLELDKVQGADEVVHHAHGSFCHIILNACRKQASSASICPFFELIFLASAFEIRSLDVLDLSMQEASPDFGRPLLERVRSCAHNKTSGLYRKS
jgi:hypothetical protein